MRNECTWYLAKVISSNSTLANSLRGETVIFKGAYPDFGTGDVVHDIKTGHTVEIIHKFHVDPIYIASVYNRPLRWCVLE